MRRNPSSRRSIGSPGLQAELLSDRSEKIDRAWMDEVKCRYEAYRAGKIRTVDHEEVVARFQARFG